MAEFYDAVPADDVPSETASVVEVNGKEADAMRMALFRPAKELRASALLVTTRSSQSIPLYSPLGSTANLTPLILWKSEQGKTYNIAITDEFDQTAKPLRLSGVVSPVDFARMICIASR